MKAMVIKGFGGTEVFEMLDLPQPRATAGHVVVKLAATSVNPVDYKIRQLGEALPFAPQLPAILGMDFAGTIVEIGKGVTDYRIGDEVYGCAGGLADLAGSLAEYMLADCRLIAHKPKRLTMTQAAALPLVSITAFEGLTRAGVITVDDRTHQSVLIHGGSGGVGHIALQLSNHFGHDVYATGGGAEQEQLIKQLGATPINYRSESVASYVDEHTQGLGFDAIFDSVGEKNLVKSIEAIKLNGQIATTSTMAELDLTTAHLKGISLHVVFMLIPMIHGIGRESHGSILATVADIVDDGGLTPVLAEREFTLNEAAAAHAYAEAGTGLGKIVINISG